MLRPSDYGLEDKIKVYDRFLYLKWNPRKDDFEVWKEPYPVEYNLQDTWRPRHTKMFSCSGIVDDRIMHRIIAADMERRQTDIDKIMDDMLKFNKKLENEKTYGTEEERGVERYGFEKHAFEKGSVTTSAGKLGGK